MSRSSKGSPKGYPKGQRRRRPPNGIDIRMSHEANVYLPINLQLQQHAVRRASIAAERESVSAECCCVRECVAALGPSRSQGQCRVQGVSGVPSLPASSRWWGLAAGWHRCWAEGRGARAECGAHSTRSDVGREELVLCGTTQSGDRRRQASRSSAREREQAEHDVAESRALSAGGCVSVRAREEGHTSYKRQRWRCWRWRLQAPRCALWFSMRFMI
jgi:hypothetical protein